MSEPTTQIGSDTLPPDGYLQPRRYREVFRCDDCGHEFSRITTKPGSKVPACPTKACKEIRALATELKEAEHREAMFESRVPPGHIGANVQVQAVDETAKIVMEDYKLTNLQDNVRRGDMIAPKLPAPQQRMADGYFGGKAMADRAGVSQRQMNILGRRAMAGAFRGMAVNPKVTAFGRPEGAPALQSIRTEKLRDG